MINLQNDEIIVAKERLPWLQFKLYIQTYPSFMGFKYYCFEVEALALEFKRSASKPKSQ